MLTVCAVYRLAGNEEAHKAALKQAALHGSAIALATDTASNPYATLCHQTVTEMMANPVTAT